MRLSRALVACAAAMAISASGYAQVAGTQEKNNLVIVRDGNAIATIVIAADSGEMERIAAGELAKYIEMMTGARLSLIVLQEGTILPSGPSIVIGKIALSADPTLQTALDRAAKRDPFTRADAIALRRVGARVYVAGNNDRSHFFAVSKLLQEWGCRWYMPTEFGEVVPEHRTLSIGKLEHIHGSPFEIRSYWLGWLGDDKGKLDFQRRNFASDSALPVFGHALGSLTDKIVPPGQTAFNVPLSDDTTAIEIASRIEERYAAGLPGISLAVEDGIYTSESQRDASLQAGIYDKYMLAPSNTDSLLTLYNNVARILRGKYPSSPTLVGGLAYANMTIPPQRVLKTEPNVMMWLAPIDIDPNHGMDDRNSPPRQEYKAMMYRWSQVMDGRLAIYDYDQAQLSWRDLPNPSHHVFAQDVKHYRNAGVLGIETESRGATATTFLNLYFRLQLMWNPDLDVDAALEEFYPKFYGPAAGSMKKYWGAIFEAWNRTITTEHEYMVAPLIYTPELIAHLRENIETAENAVAPLKLKAHLTRNEALYLERIKFTRLSFSVIENYIELVEAGAGQAEYRRAVLVGERALEARERLTAMNPTFTTYERIGEPGLAWLPGEIQQMRELASLTDGTKGQLIVKTPLEWSFRRDPHDTGLARGWAYMPADLSYWKTHGKPMPVEARKDYADAWETLRTDLFAQGQGIRHPDGQSFTGFYWYQTSLALTQAQVQGEPHLMFPGLFNECWLYVNGELVSHRPFAPRWWNSDYKFDWDVNLAGRLKAGENLITLRGSNPHHFGGMFRRPFLYRARQPE